MITNFEKYNESIKSLLVGPTKEEVWKNLGYDEQFDTAEEFMNYIITNIKILKQNITSSVIWVIDKTPIFIQNSKDNFLWVNSNKIFYILESVFNLNSRESYVLVKNIVEEKLNLYKYILTINGSETAVGCKFKDIDKLLEYKQFNDGIKSLLVGPTKEEVWKNLGFDKSFNTPEKFLTYILDNSEHIGFIETDYWIYKDEIYFKYDRIKKKLYINNPHIINILGTIFELNNRGILKLIKEIIEIKLKLNISESQIIPWIED